MADTDDDTDASVDSTDDDVRIHGGIPLTMADLVGAHYKGPDYKKLVLELNKETPSINEIQDVMGMLPNIDTLHLSTTYHGYDECDTRTGPTDEELKRQKHFLAIFGQAVKDRNVPTVIADKISVTYFLPELTAFAEDRATKTMQLTISERDAPNNAIITNFGHWLASPSCHLEDLHLISLSDGGLNHWFEILAEIRSPSPKLRHVDIGQHHRLADDAMLGCLPEFELLKMELFKQVDFFSFTGLNLTDESLKEFVKFLKPFVWLKAMAVRIANMDYEYSGSDDEEDGGGDVPRRRVDGAGMVKASMVTCKSIQMSCRDGCHNTYILIPWVDPAGVEAGKVTTDWIMPLECYDVFCTKLRPFLTMVNNEFKNETDEDTELIKINRWMRTLRYDVVKDKMVQLFPAFKLPAAEEEKRAFKKRKTSHI